MGIRETINRQPLLVGSVVGVIVLFAAWFAFYSQADGGPDAPTTAAYSTDDGATWFEAEADLIVPFTKDGKTVVGAELFSNDNGKTKYVGYLFRYDQSALKRLSNPSARKLADLPVGEQIELKAAVEVKSPRASSAGWVSASSPAAEAILTPRTPSGANALTVNP